MSITLLELEPNRAQTPQITIRDNQPQLAIEPRIQARPLCREIRNMFDQKPRPYIFGKTPG